MNIGVIGHGTRIQRVLQLLSKIKPCTHKIIGIYDPNFDSSKDYQGEFKNIKIYDDYISLIKNTKIDWIFIGSWNCFHKNHIIDSLKANKNIFCEKPLAVNLKECLEIKRASRNFNKNFLISYPLRYSFHYLYIKDLIKKGRIGKIISLEFNDTLHFNHGAFIMTDWRRFNKNSGGHLLEKCCHDIDIVNWITESKAKKVSSFGGLEFFKPDNSYLYNKIKSKKEIIFNKKIIPNPFISKKDIIDNQVVIMEFENKIRATFHTNCNSLIPERRIYLCGTEGTIRANLLEGKIEYKRFDSEKKFTKVFNKKMRESHGGGDKHLVEELSKVMKRKKKRNDLNDALKSAITCLAIEEAMQKSKVIKIKSLWNKLKLHQ